MSNIHLTRDDVIYSDATPVGNVTPEYIGQICITNDDKVFFANGLANTNWIGAGGDIDLRNLATKEELNVVSAKLGTVNEQVENNKSTIITHTNEINSIKQQLEQSITLISEDLTVIEGRLG